MEIKVNLTTITIIIAIMCIVIIALLQNEKDIAMMGLASLIGYLAGRWHNNQEKKKVKMDK